MLKMKQCGNWLVISAGLMISDGYAQEGAAAGGTVQGSNSKLEYCSEPLGTLAVYENRRDRWWHDYYRRYPNLGSTAPVLKMLIQQSNCFVVVERGKTLRNIKGERDLEKTGELRSGSGFGKGQLVAADYTMTPSIQFSEKTGGLAGTLGGLLGEKNKYASAIVGNLKRNSASTTLLLVDNRSSVQVAASVGNASRIDFGLGHRWIGTSSTGAADGYLKTPEGKIILSAFADSYNKMVQVLRNYKAQTVEGGLGKGGKLKIGD